MPSRITGLFERLQRLYRHYDACETIWQCETQSSCHWLDDTLILRLVKRMHSLERRMKCLLERLDASLASGGLNVGGENTPTVVMCQLCIDRYSQGLGWRWIFSGGTYAI
jgi:hypothetical protein